MKKYSAVKQLILQNRKLLALFILNPFFLFNEAFSNSQENLKNEASLTVELKKTNVASLTYSVEFEEPLKDSISLLKKFDYLISLNGKPFSKIRSPSFAFSKVKKIQIIATKKVNLSTIETFTAPVLFHKVNPNYKIVVKDPVEMFPFFNEVINNNTKDKIFLTIANTEKIEPTVLRTKNSSLQTGRLESDFKIWYDQFKLHFPEYSVNILLNPTRNGFSNNFIFCSTIDFCKLAVVESLFSRTINPEEGNYALGISSYLNNRFLSGSEARLERYIYIMEFFLNRWKISNLSIEKMTKGKPGKSSRLFQIRSFFYFYQLCEILGHTKCFEYFKEVLNTTDNSITWSVLINRLENLSKSNLSAYHEFWYNTSHSLQPNIEKTWSKENVFEIKIFNLAFPFNTIPKVYVGEQVYLLPFTEKEKSIYIEEPPQQLKICFDPDFETLRSIPISETTPVFKGLLLSKSPKVYIDSTIKLTKSQKQSILKILKPYNIKLDTILKYKTPTLIITSQPKQKKFKKITHFIKNKFILENKGIQAIPFVYENYLSNVLLNAMDFEMIIKMLNEMIYNLNYELIDSKLSKQFITPKDSPLCHLDNLQDYKNKK